MEQFNQHPEDPKGQVSIPQPINPHLIGSDTKRLDEKYLSIPAANNEAEGREVSPPIENELRTSFSERELRNRYEGNRRDFLAQEARKKRNALRQKEATIAQRLLDELSELGDSTKSNEDHIRARVEGKNSAIQQFAVDPFKAEIDTLKRKQEERGFLKKLSYRFRNDPLQEEVTRLSAKIREEERKIADNEANLQTEVLNLSEHLTKRTVLAGDLLEGHRKEFTEKRKLLLNETHSHNTSTREVAKNTFEALQRGDLDISKLAAESNAIVVHAIPLDGWNMKNTSMNNSEIKNIETLSAKEKFDILAGKQPDVSASVLSAGNVIKGQEMFYPFGFILDGKLMASYEGDEGTYADGETRRRKEQFNGTLQNNTKDQFNVVANSPAQVSIGGQYNESIVHEPRPKGVIIDEVVLVDRQDKGDQVKEYFPFDQKEEVVKKFGTSIVATGEGVPSSGEYTGKHVFRIERKRTAMEKALEYASNNHPDLPIYIRKQDGIYTKDGRKVTAAEIYA